MKKGLLLIQKINTIIVLFSVMLFQIPQTFQTGIAAKPFNTLTDVIDGKSTSDSAVVNDLHWDSSFNYSPGPNGRVNTLVMDEIGNLFVAGAFAAAGDIIAGNIAGWDGINWFALGSGTNGPVRDILYDGNGNIYAGGEFTIAGGVNVNYIAKWDGQAWTSLGSGTDGIVNTLAIDENGNIYAGGWFTSTGGIPTHNIAKWDGSSWTALGNGVNGLVNILAFDETDNLFVGGNFTVAGSGPANNVAQWDGNTWSNLGTGTNAPVKALAIGINGNLVAGGDFTQAGNENANHIASWNGSSWSALGSGTNNAINSIIYDGMGNVYVGGEFTVAGGLNANRIARWDGVDWSLLDSGMDNTVYALYLGNELIAGGIFETSGDINAQYIAVWDNDTWKSFGNGVNNYVNDLESDSLANLYSGGTFDHAGGGVSERIAKWNGDGWSSLGSGLDTTVHALVMNDIGDLYAGGAFTMAGDEVVNYIARWDGSQWFALGSGMDNATRAVAIAENGNLIAGGLFVTAGGNIVNHIAMWDGNNWSDMGGGMNGTVGAIAVDSNGDIYAGGDFTLAGGTQANRIARWDGDSWSALGSGMNHLVNTILIVGGDLYAGGLFTTAGGNTVNYIARWNGTNWSSLGSGTNGEVFTIAVNEIGNIIAGGSFTTAGGVEVNHIALWDGTSWSALGSGMNGNVYTIEIRESDFYAGGAFTSAGNKPSDYIARWFNSPPIANGDNYSTDEDNLLSVPIPGVLGNDVDPENDPLDTSVVSGPAHGTLNLNSDGSFNYNPDEDYSGNDSFAYAASDKFLTDTATVIITINEVNDPPVLDPLGDQFVDEQNLLSFTATADDVDDPQGDLTFSLDPGAPTGASITPGGDFSWLPSESQGPGIYPVTIRVTDDGTPPLSDYETIDITVGEVNSAPTIDPIDDQIVDEGSQLTFTASAGDEDIPANDLVFSLDPGAPSGASITPGGVFTWTPQEAQGPDIYQISIRVTDNGEPPLSDFDIFNVLVNEVNQSPTALDDFYFAIQNTPLEISPPGVLSNDVDEDIPPNPLSAIQVSNPTHGLLEFNQDGSFVYTPEADYLGSDGFTYLINDGLENSNIATVTFSVTLENNAPIVFAGEDMSGNEGDEMSFSGSFIDPGLLSGISSGESIRWNFGDGYQITGTLTPTHVYSDNGIYLATLTVTDTLGGVGTDTLEATIANVIPSIEEQPDRYLSIGMVFNLAAHFSDPGSLDTHSGTLSWGDGIVEPAIIDQGSKTMIGSHSYQLAGQYNITLLLRDDDGGQIQTNFHIFVSGNHNYLPLINKN